MSLLSFDVTVFRERFPAYSDPDKYSDATLQAYWDVAILYISNEADYGRLTGDSRAQAIYLLMAHMVFLAAVIASGGTGGTVQASTIDKISVTLVAPPIKSEFDFWLNQSPYGMQLLVLLGIKSSGGWYIPATNINPRGMR